MTLQCPACNAQPRKSYRIGVADCGELEDIGLVDAPEAGAVVVCPVCAAVLKVNDDITLRFPHQEEWWAILNDTTLSRALAVTRTTVIDRGKVKETG